MKQVFRIIAHPYYGVLVDGKLLSGHAFMEWNRLERKRKSNREYMRRVRAGRKAA